jgi:hypothetical protein
VRSRRHRTALHLPSMWSHRSKPEQMLPGEAPSAAYLASRIRYKGRTLTLASLLGRTSVGLARSLQPTRGDTDPALPVHPPGGPTWTVGLALSMRCGLRAPCL